MAGCRIGKYHIRQSNDYNHLNSIISNEHFCADHLDSIEDFCVKSADTKFWQLYKHGNDVDPKPDKLHWQSIDGQLFGVCTQSLFR